MAQEFTSFSGPIRDQIEKYDAELNRLTELLASAFGGRSRASNAPEERVVHPLLVSCAGIVEEIVFNCRAGFGVAALRSVRTMYECIVTARHLNLHPDKTQAFLNRFYAQWAKIIQTVPQDLRGAELHTTLAAKVSKYAQGKMVGTRDLDWSGEYTLKMAREAGSLAELHSIAFDYTSAFVHPSAVFVLNALSKVDGENVLRVGMNSQDLEAEQALRTAHDLILNAVDLRLMYFTSEALEMQFQACKQDFVKIWGFPPHL